MSKLWEKQWTKVIRVIFCAILVSWIFKLFVFTFYSIPSESMEPMLWPKDEVIVSKYLYGPRIDFKSLFSFQKPSIGYRLSGFMHIKRGDIVVFNAPYDYGITLVKRCAAAAGDTLVIRNSNVYIDGKQNEASCIYFDFVLTSKDTIATNKSLFTLGIKPDSLSYYHKKKCYFLSISNTDEKLLASLNSTESICRDTSFQKNNKYIFPKSMRGLWDQYNYGPLVIPQKNKTIWLDRKSILIYYSVFRFEQKNITDSNGNLYINKKLVKSYTFKNNYYFVMGDNRDKSFDSRWIGLIPEDLIIGKAVCVLNFGHLVKGSSYGRLKILK